MANTLSEGQHGSSMLGYGQQCSWGTRLVVSKHCTIRETVMSDVKKFACKVAILVTGVVGYHLVMYCLGKVL